MAGDIKARCPGCGKHTSAFWDRTRYVFVTHGPNVHAGDSCPSSGWLVEDDEILTGGPT